MSSSRQPGVSLFQPGSHTLSTAGSRGTQQPGIMAGERQEHGGRPTARLWQQETSGRMRSTVPEGMTYRSLSLWPWKLSVGGAQGERYSKMGILSPRDWEAEVFGE